MNRFQPVKVRTVKQAIGARCLDCGQVFTESFPWHWRKSQALHEKGTGHKMELFTIKEKATP